MISHTSKSKTADGTLDAAKTRAALESMLTRTFDPESLDPHKLNKNETARFIAEQARKLRLAALRSGQPGLVWMIESVYYEAYTTGCAKTGLELEQARRKN